MSKRIEIEQKFYCNNHDKLLQIIQNNGLCKCSERFENDEYFTDIDSIYIKNRTCLRIRNVNNEYLELTFKGKSKELTNNYAKIENNINLEISNYDSVVGLLYSLGYFSYSIVKKDRIVYTKKENDLEYNVMIDKIQNLGDFVEFELLYYDSEKDMSYLQGKLNDFVKGFEALNFESANLPYRDFVAHKTYISILPQNKLNAILFDLDGTLADTDLLVVEGFLRFYRKYKPGEKVPFRLLASFSGPTLKETFERYFPSYNSDELVKDFKTFSLPLYQTFVETYPDTFEGLQILKEHGIRIGVITSKMRDPSLRTLNNLGLTPYVDLLIAWDDVTKPKPDTEGIERALKSVS